MPIIYRIRRARQSIHITFLFHIYTYYNIRILCILQYYANAIAALIPFDIHYLLCVYIVIVAVVAVGAAVVVVFLSCY